MKPLNKLIGGLCIALALFPALADQLRPGRTMCTTEASYDAYQEALAINDTVSLSQLKQTNCYSTSQVENADVTVLKPGVTMSYVRITFRASGDSANVYVPKDAVRK